MIAFASGAVDPIMKGWDSKIATEEEQGKFLILRLCEEWSLPSRSIVNLYKVTDLVIQKLNTYYKIILKVCAFWLV